MSLILSLLGQPPIVLFPTTVEGWLGLLLWVAALGGLLALWRKHQVEWDNGKVRLFIVLLLLTPLSSVLLGVRLPEGQGLTLPGIAFEPGGLPVMLLAALPWVLAAGFLGTNAATGLGLLSGFVLAIWGTHSVFTALEWATLALIAAAALQQRYRTPWFRALRHPLLSVFLVSLLYPLLFLFNSIFLAHGSLAARLDYAILYQLAAWQSFAIPALIAGAVAEFARFAFPSAWGGQPPYQPSPVESSLEARFLFILAPLFIGLLLVFVVGDWIIAGNAARQMVEARMAAASQAVASGVPYFLNTGQSLSMHIAETLDLDAMTDVELDEALAANALAVPFFRQLFVLDANLEPRASFPRAMYDALPTTLEEQVGLTKAVEASIPVQVYTIPVDGEARKTDFTFLATIFREDGSPAGVLLGRAALDANPLSRGILTNLNSLADLGGAGMLVDKAGEILYHSPAEQMLNLYAGEKPAEARLFDNTAPDGSRQFVYYRPIPGTPWGVVMLVPARQAQQIAIDIAAPALVMVVLLALGGVLFMRLSLGVITASLRTLTDEAERIAQGQLDHTLQTEGADETGRLRRAFEKMRLSLKARLEELNRLLLVSQSVASNVQLEDALQPILESALTFGASAARVVLVPGVVPARDGETESSSRFGAGEGSQWAAYYDDQILALVEQSGKDELVLTNPARASLLIFDPDAPQLDSLMAVALRHERTYFGVLWVAYDQPHPFSEQEVQFLFTLGGHAALAAANARLFLTAEVERERLAAILASTPDPVLVTDAHDRLLLINAAAWGMLGVERQISVGKPISEVVKQDDLVALLTQSEEGPQTREVTLPDGRVFMATASSILMDERRIGRVCVLKDVTEFKELDTLKTEFVATVSHDLRSPLTLMRGYATMLEMVGELNPQQMEYVRKIVFGVENISRLVNDLLDLGRIEAGVGLQLTMQPVRDLVESVVTELRIQARQKSIALQVEVAAETPPVIEADRTLLQRALHNLVENAIKYTPEGGSVWVRVSPRREGVLFAVQDNGIGVSPVDQPRLFEKFYRSADRRAKRQHGTGLGLAIVKSIVERHGGQVGVESKLGEGSTFYFEIPSRQS